MARSDHATESTPDPWAGLSPQALRVLRHRLACCSNADIAARYGCQQDTVRYYLKLVIGHLRACGLEVHDTADALVIAAGTGLEPEGLRSVEP